MSLRHHPGRLLGNMQWATQDRNWGKHKRSTSTLRALQEKRLPPATGEQLVPGVLTS